MQAAGPRAGAFAHPGCHAVFMPTCETPLRSRGPWEQRLAAEQIWRAEDGLKLKALRESCGWDLWDLSRACALSASQIRQLEDGGESLFYTAAIKAHAGRHALACLEAQSRYLTRRATAPPPTPRPDTPASDK